MAEWKEKQLGELVDIGSSKRIFYKEYVPVGIPFYRSKEVIEKHNGKAISTELQISIEKYNDIKEKFGVPVEGDMLLTSVGTLGIPYIVQKNENFYFKDGNLTWFKKFNNSLLNQFLYYWIISPVGKGELDMVSIGSTQPALTISGLKGIVINTPPLPEQKAIASVLSSLDDKIDLLHRQNKTLEAMAETLFRQWFVDSNTNSYYTFEELVDSVSVKHSFPKETIIFLNTSDIYDGHVLNHNYSEVKALPGQAKKSIKKGDVLFTEIRPANRRFAYIDFDAEEYVVSTKLMVLRSKDVLSRSIMFFFLKTQETLNWLQMLAEARSGTFPQITFDDFKRLEIYVPSGTKLPELAGLFDSIFEKTFKNQSQIRTLEKLRDTLLPKLMSGEVRVKI